MTTYTVIFKRDKKEIFKHEVECYLVGEAIAATKILFQLSVRDNGKPYEIEVTEDEDFL